MSFECGAAFGVPNAVRSPKLPRVADDGSHRFLRRAEVARQPARNYRMSIPLILVVPGLLALPAQVLAASASLGRLARLAPAPRVAPLGIAAALVDALGARAATPIAPLAALGAGAEPGTHYVAAADPVHLVADRDDL